MADERLLDDIECDDVSILARYLDAHPTHVDLIVRGSPLLCHTLFHGQFKCARYLVEHGANPLLPDRFGISPFANLILSSLNPGFDEMAQLLAPYATIDEAAQCGLVDRVRDIIAEHPEQLESLAVTGMTPLMRASQHGQVEMIRFLLEAGANRETVDENEHNAAWFNCDLYRGPDRQERKQQILALLA
eukprot:TRINITY_DN9537_c0_g1_i2.p1 TRINITY_DN9537_c0_g1~~TRINITY_DN9537_c0_g1_i2.p1  ORF type:complete len:189 (+),score=42.85 TRINITY_DN9537_c0_g1_i2:80-646(+)